MRRRLEQRVHRPVRPDHVRHRFGEVEAGVEAPPVRLAEPHPQPEAVERDRDDGGRVRRAASVRSSSSPHSMFSRAPCAACRCCSSSAQWATSESAVDVTELRRLDALRAPQIVDGRLTRRQPQHHPARPSRVRAGARPRMRCGTDAGATFVISSTAVNSSSWRVPRPVRPGNRQGVRGADPLRGPRSGPGGSAGRSPQYSSRG